MNVRHFYCEKITQPQTLLSGTEAHHLASVLRLQKDSLVELFDGKGSVASAVIKDLRNQQVLLNVVEQKTIPQRTAGRIIIAVSVAKADRFGWLVEKCTELGIDRISPLLFDRTVKTAAGPQTLQRWHRLAVSAAKQSGRYFLPVIDSPASLTDILDTLRIEFSSADILLGSSSLQALPIIRYPFSSKDVMVFVGPEGGLTDSEKELLQKRGAKTVRLTDTILRVETAALALASILTAQRDSSQ
jgi:16S rRNA (uracil1498-N3)-methyltransferase